MNRGELLVSEVAKMELGLMQSVAVAAIPASKQLTVAMGSEY